MLGRLLDDSFPAAVRRDVTTVTVARMAANACYRFTAPFLATIARGLDVSIGQLGLFIAISELCGLSAPWLGRAVDRYPRRGAMAVGLGGVATGAAVIAASNGLAAIGIGLVLVAQSKNLFDVGLGAWIADHVDYGRRGRVVGLTETSWALGLLVGVSTLGLVAAASGWRWSYVTGGAAVAAMTVVVAVRIDPAHRSSAGNRNRAAPMRLGRAGWSAVIGVGALMAAGQCLFVTFGPWLENEHGFGAAGLAATTFGLGAMELAASSLSAARTDRWGKERSVQRGALLMAPSALLLAAGHGHAVSGLAALALFFGGFEFAIVSALAIGGALMPGAPARGLGATIAAGTVGKAVASVPATWLYERHGVVWPATLGAVIAVVAFAGMRSREASLARLAGAAR